MRAFFRACAERGLDVHGHCTVEAYNGAVQEVYRMPTRLPSARILLVGNSAALWPHVDRFARQRGCRHPVQEYVEETVLACLRDAYGKDESRPLSERAPAIRHRRHRRQNAKTPKLKMCLG